MTILFVGIDLAKNVFALHSVNEAGRAELGPAVPRDRLHELIGPRWMKNPDRRAPQRQSPPFPNP